MVAPLNATIMPGSHSALSTTKIHVGAAAPQFTSDVKQLCNSPQVLLLSFCSLLWGQLCLLLKFKDQFYITLLDFTTNPSCFFSLTLYSLWLRQPKPHPRPTDHPPLHCSLPVYVVFISSALRSKMLTIETNTKTRRDQREGPNI